MRYAWLRASSAKRAVVVLVASLWALSSVADPPSSREGEGAPPPLESHPGFFDLGAADVLTRDNLEIHISVKGPLLQLVAAAGRESEPDLSEALERLSGIEVRVYNLPENRRSRARTVLDRTAESLQKKGWREAVTVRVERSHGYAFLRYAGEDPVGLVAMYVTDSNQAVFVNIVGTLDMVTIGRLARRFDLDLLAVTEKP